MRIDRGGGARPSHRASRVEHEEMGFSFAWDKVDDEASQSGL